MQISPRLPGAAVNGHGAAQVVIAYLRKHDPQGFQQGVRAVVVKFLQCGIAEPDCHRELPVSPGL